VRHADLLVAERGRQRRLLDNAHLLQAARVAGEELRDLLEEAVVDLVDELHVPRQHHLEHVNVPLLERLRQHRVVGVRVDPRGDVPRLVPRKVLLVHKQPH